VTRLRAAADQTFRSMRWRNFRLFFFGQIVSQVGNWLTLVAQVLLVTDLGGGGIELGILAAAQFGPVLLIGPWAGLVGDRSDKRRLLIIVQIIAMMQSFALAVLAFSGNPPLYAIYAVAFVGGITIAFDNPSRRAFVVEMVPEEDINNAVSLNSALMTSARVVGPAVAGVLVVVAGFGWAFLADGVSYVAVITALAMMRTSELRRPPVAAKAKGQVREGLRYARSVPELWVPLMMMVVIGTLAYNFQVVFPLFVEHDLGGTNLTYTLLFSVVSVGALAGALIAARRTRIDIRSVAAAAVGYGVALTLMTFVPSTPFAFGVGVLMGLGSIFFLTASTSIVQIRSKPSMRGRVLALQAMVFLGSTPIGGLFVGWICEVFGARAGVAVGAIAALGAGAWGMVMARRRAVALRLTPEEATGAVEIAIADYDGDADLTPARGTAAVTPTPGGAG